MVELKAYKICDIDVRAIIGQEQRFWLWLHCCFAVPVWPCHSARKRKPGFYPAKEGRPAICFYRSEPKVCKKQEETHVPGVLANMGRGAMVPSVGSLDRALLWVRKGTRWW